MKLGRVGDLLWQLSECVSLDFRQKSVAVKLLEDARDKQPPGSWSLHHLLAHRRHQDVGARCSELQQQLERHCCTW